MPGTERLLARLPGLDVVWIVIWSAVPWANAGLNLLFDTGERSAVWEQSRPVVLLNYAALSLAILVAFFGSRVMARRVEALDETATQLFVDASTRRSFREINLLTGPLAGTAATALAFGSTAYLEDGWAAAVLRGATWLVAGFPLWSFLWTYAALQLGLNRLGHARLRDEPTLVDPSLSLRPLGAVSFLGLWLLVVAIVPVVVTGAPDVIGLVLGLLVLCGGLAAFGWSLLGLRRQIVDWKEEQLALARKLYAEAYGPVRAARTLEALREQHTLLGAADSLEKRVRGIHDWPVSEGTWAWVIGIATSVVAIACARLILRPFGF